MNFIYYSWEKVQQRKGVTTEWVGGGVGRLPLFTFHFANKKLIRLINNNNNKIS